MPPCLPWSAVFKVWSPSLVYIFSPSNSLGSGKSHTVAVILENMFISNSSLLGTLQKPLSGLVLHFGEGGTGSGPCEAAWIGVANHPSVSVPPVKVYVSKSSLNTMKSVYASLMQRGNVVVEPLIFDESELDAQAFLSLMAVGSANNAPLYVQIILVSDSQLYHNQCLSNIHCSQSYVSSESRSPTEHSCESWNQRRLRSTLLNWQASIKDLLSWSHSWANEIL